MSKYSTIPLGNLAAWPDGVIRVYNSADPGEALGHHPGFPPTINFNDLISNVGSTELGWLDITQQQLDDLIDDANNSIDTPDVDSIVVIVDNAAKAAE